MILRSALERVTAFTTELRRRHVFRVAAVYAVVAWLVVQVAVNTFPYLHLSPALVTAVIAMAVLGFPVAVVLAWAFEMTPEGVRRAGPSEPPSPRGARRAGGPELTRLGRIPISPAPRAPAPADPQPLPPADPERVERASQANLRHELRTPLNVIIGYSEMLLEDLRANGRDRELDSIRGLHASAKHVLGLVEEALSKDLGGGGGANGDVAARSLLLEPARALTRDAQHLVARCAGREDNLVPDLQRIAAAAARLEGLLEELIDPNVASAVSALSQTRAIAQRAMARIRPLSDSLPTTAPRHGHLLVVDDNALNRDLLSRQLARQGFSVATAADGREALARLRAQDFDLVLLDVLMPEVDGIEVLEEMQRDTTLRDIPVIMISALDEIDSVVGCIEKGAADYLAKPFDAVLLRARIGSIMEIHQLRDQQRRTTEELRAMQAWSDQVMDSFLSARAAAALRAGKPEAVETHPEAMALVLQLQGTGTLAARIGGPELLGRLDQVLGLVDRVASAHRVDGMCLGGRTVVFFAGPEEDDPAGTIADLALEISAAVETCAGGSDALCVGIGVHAGLLVVGVGGGGRLFGGCWGDAVEVAQSLAIQAKPGTVRVSPAAYALLHQAYELESQGVTELSGLGHTLSYRLTSRKPSMVD